MFVVQRNTSRSQSAQKKLNASLFKAVRAKDDEGVRTALEAGADANATCRGWSALGRACRSMRPEDGYKSGRAVARLMLATGTVPDNRIAWWHVAEALIFLGEAEALRLLIEGAGDAQRKERIDHIRSLLATRALASWPCGSLDPDMSRMLPLVFSTSSDAAERVEHRSSRRGHAECQSTWLHLAVSGMRYCDHCGDSFRDVPHLLLDHLLTLRPPLEMRWFGMTPLHLAALSGNRHAFAALLNAGADPNAVDGHDRVMGRGYGHLTDEEVAALDAHRLRASLPSAISAPSRRL